VAGKIAVEPLRQTHRTVEAWSGIGAFAAKSSSACSEASVSENYRTGQDTLEVSLPRWNEIQRILISRPIGAQPFDGHRVPRPHLQDGTLVQVNAYVSDTGEIVERWLLSETDERWYKLEAWRDKWVTLKMAKRVAISG